MSELTLDEAIKHCLEVAENNEQFASGKWIGSEGEANRQECEQCAADHRQLAEWLMELKDLRAGQNDQYVFIRELMDELEEAKRLLKLAVEQMAEVGEVCDCIHSQDCPLDECGKFTFHNEITKLIEG